MEINKKWYLDDDLFPDINIDKELNNDEATKKQFDSVTIWHKGDYRPIVFSEYVNSRRGWTKASFKRGLEKCFKTLQDGGQRLEYYYILKYPSNSVKWGCRTFTEKDLNEIADAFEFHYNEKVER